MHWLQLDFVGSESNRDGIGVVVESTMAIVSGSLKWVPVGHNSSSELLTIGVGDSTTVDLAVRFPSGMTQNLSV